MTEQKQELDLNNYVPKEEYEKAVKAKDESLNGLKTELEEAKMKLLDEDYLNYLNSKTAKKAAKPAPESSDGISLSELKSELEDLRAELNLNKNTISQLYFDRELELTKRKYPDFDDYREDIQKILDISKGEKTFAEAYLIAKATKDVESETKEPKKKSTFSSEKPTGVVPHKTVDKKEFKTQSESDEAVINDLKAKYPGLGDTI